MDNVEIIAITAVIAIVAVRLYQKYFKKDKDKSGTDSKTLPGSMFPSSSKDDEYEPYSKN